MSKEKMERAFHYTEPLHNVAYRLGGRGTELTIWAYVVGYLYAQMYYVIGEKDSLAAGKKVFGKAHLTKNYMGTRFSMWSLTEHLIKIVTTSGCRLEVYDADGTLTADTLMNELTEAFQALPDPTQAHYHFMGVPIGTEQTKPTPEEALEIANNGSTRNRRVQHI